VPEPRALVFDLDDTLYPYRQFVSSGFRAVASWLEREHGVSAALVTRTLCRARVVGERGQEMQYLCRTLGLRAALVPILVALLRDHAPTLRLPESSRQVLQRLRPSWRLGILTNGSPAIQARKIAALGLDALVDTVVYASACGDGRGKPAIEGFHVVLQRLDAQASSTVFVGDDAVADIEGASNVGMRTIHVRQARRPEARCDAAVATLRAVPFIAERLVSGGEADVV